MGKLTLGAGFDAEGLDDAEYDDSFEPYSGPLPPNGTVLKFRMVRGWSTTSISGNFMIKAMFIAEESGEYDGLPVVENIPFTENAAWKYQPWLRAMGLTAKRIKANTIVADDEDEKWGGPQIISIGKWQPGSDDAVCFIKTGIDAEYDPDKPKAVAIKLIALDSEDAPENYRAPKPSQAAQQRATARRTQQRTAKPPEDDSLFEDEPPF
jgi:hypothetical protein